MPGASRHRIPRYAVYFLAWTVAGIFYLSQDITRRLYWHDPTPWLELLSSWMVGVYISAALTPGVLWLGRRWPVERQNWPRRVPLHLLLSVVFSVTQLALETVISVELRLMSSMDPSFLGRFPALLVFGFHANVLAYWAIIGIQAGFRYYRGYQERELHASQLKAQLMRAQLSALKMQLQPHFLFNTLNAIVVLVRQQKSRQAEEMLARLSDLLRWVLDDVDTQEVPLRRELEYLQLYLAIEEVRFQDRLRVEISADPEILDAAVPHMGLQPIVENAVRHGIGRSSAAGKVEIRAARVNETLEVQVEDDGPGMPAGDSPEGRGIGLANTRARLNQLYGDAASLTVENGNNGGVVVSLILPFRLASEDEKPDEHVSDNPDSGRRTPGA